MTYHIVTYGCQMNKSDSERIDSYLQSANFKPAKKSQADILIINACSVRQSAIDRVWGQIHKSSKSKQPFFIITGCVLPDDKKKFKQKNILFLPIKNLPNWPKQIKIQNSKLIQNSKFKIKNSSHCSNGYLSIPPNRQSQITAYVPIMTGCNNFCTYCAVPYTRGRETSRPPEDILKEVYTLITQGYKEIILLGQNVNSYQGKIKSILKLNHLKFNHSKFNQNSKFKIQNSKTINFPTLLTLIDSIPGNYWLNFTSSHPKDLSNELIKCYRTLKHLTPYLHLALQSGSDKILKKMNRQYTTQYFTQLIKKIRQTNPALAISTDIIVGFPGETKNDFNQTVKIMRQIKFAMAYIAQFSPRPNTAAAKMKDNITKQEKKNREKILTEILKKTALEHNKKLINTKQKILVEKYDSDKKSLFGHSAQAKRVKITTNLPHNGAKKLIGQFINIKISKVSAWHLSAKYN